MNRHKKISRLIAAVLAAVMCAACFCSCTFLNPDRIVEYYFVSCTTPNNALYLNGYYGFDEAMELAHAIEAIPDPVSTEGVYSYVISMLYVEDGVEKRVEKTGYDTFPDNWDRIVELTNIIPNSSKQISNSRDVAVIDEDYLVEHHCTGSKYLLLPDDMTYSEVIKGADINYLTLYSPDSRISTEYRVETAIRDYLYDLYDLRSHQIEKLDKDPAKSSTEEMKEFARDRFDKVDWDSATEYSISGSYKDWCYIIVRYDMVEAWLDERSKQTKKCGFDGPNCQYQEEIAWELFASSGIMKRDVFVDGSGRFLILTDFSEFRKPDDIAALVK